MWKKPKKEVELKLEWGDRITVDTKTKIVKDAIFLRYIETSRGKVIQFIYQNNSLKGYALKITRLKYVKEGWEE